MDMYRIHYICRKDGRVVQTSYDKLNLFASRKEAKDLAKASIETFNAGCKAGIWTYSIKKM